MGRPGRQRKVQLCHDVLARLSRLESGMSEMRYYNQSYSIQVTLPVLTNQDQVFRSHDLFWPIFAQYCNFIWFFLKRANIQSKQLKSNQTSPRESAMIWNWSIINTIYLLSSDWDWAWAGIGDWDRGLGLGTEIGDWGWEMGMGKWEWK